MLSNDSAAKFLENVVAACKDSIPKKRTFEYMNTVLEICEVLSDNNITPKVKVHPMLSFEGEQFYVLLTDTMKQFAIIAL